MGETARSSHSRKTDCYHLNDANGICECQQSCENDQWDLEKIGCLVATEEEPFLVIEFLCDESEVMVTARESTSAAVYTEVLSHGEEAVVEKAIVDREKTALAEKFETAYGETCRSGPSEKTTDIVGQPLMI